MLFAPAAFCNKKIPVSECDTGIFLLERLMGVEPYSIANRGYFLPFILYIMLLGILHFGFCYRLKTKSVYF